jgi:hypothetical protein
MTIDVKSAGKQYQFRKDSYFRRGLRGQTDPWLVEVTWHNTIADFPFLSVGVTDLPIPIGGFCLLLFNRRTNLSWDTARSDFSPPRNCADRLIRAEAIMDIFILLATMLACFLIGMPIAYAPALAIVEGWSTESRWKR